MISTDRLQELCDWFSGIGAIAEPGEAMACEVVRALEELLAFRDGYDPSERLPEDGKPVWLEFAGEYDDPAPGFWDEESERWICHTKRVWERRRERVKRWHPLPGGER